MALAVVAAPLALAEGRSPGPVEAVAGVDLARYAGLWYEIARLPNTFQDRLRLLRHRQLHPTRGGPPHRRQRVSDRPGNVEAGRGRGEARDEGRSGLEAEGPLRPRFLSFLGFVWGDYWILDLADDYSYALVGSPSRKYLWVLARQPTLEAATYAGILKKAESMGFDVTRVVRTPQELN